MRRIVGRCPAFSKVSVKGRTVIPREIYDQLKLRAGDTLRYRMMDNGILLDNASNAGRGPFVVFAEWTSEADEKAYGGL